MPAHTHASGFNQWAGFAGGGGGSGLWSAWNSTGTGVDTGSAGSDGGHTHTLSSATTLEPSSITCKMCQVN